MRVDTVDLRCLRPVPVAPIVTMPKASALDRLVRGAMWSVIFLAAVFAVCVVVPISLIVLGVLSTLGSLALPFFVKDARKAGVVA